MKFLETKLIDSLSQVSKLAIESGALETAPTLIQPINEQDISFQVRVLNGFRKKKKGYSISRNPFLPYEKSLYVKHLNSGHVILLNKYNLVPNHFLIVTPIFEPQESLLTLNEFTALVDIHSQLDVLSFYNSGRQAGASQPHRHLQALPLDKLPIDGIMASIPSYQPEQLPQLPFKHLACKLDLKSNDAGYLFSLYQQMLSTLSLITSGQENPAPYNLLMTRQWMLVVPRSEGRPDGVAINALGYAGFMLAKNQQQFNHIKTTGILNLLTKASR